MSDPLFPFEIDMFATQSFPPGRWPEPVFTYVTVNIGWLRGDSGPLWIGSANAIHVPSRAAWEQRRAKESGVVNICPSAARFYDAIDARHGREHAGRMLDGAPTCFIGGFRIAPEFRGGNVGLRALQEVHARLQGIRIVLEAAPFTVPTDPDARFVYSTDERAYEKLRAHVAIVGYERVPGTTLVMREPDAPLGPLVSLKAHQLERAKQCAQHLTSVRTSPRPGLRLVRW